MKTALKSILKISMRNKLLKQLLIIIAISLTSIVASLDAQSSITQAKWSFYENDEITNCFLNNIFNKSNPRFIYMLNKKTDDSLYYLQFDVTSGEIINRKTVPQFNYYNGVMKPYSPDMKWCVYFYYESKDKSGWIIQSLENPFIKKKLFENTTFYGYELDSINKRIFLSKQSTDTRQLGGAIYTANYETNDTGRILIKGVTGNNFVYDYKRNHIITVDFEEIIGIGFRTLIQFFDANTGELVKQLTPYEGMSFPPDGEKFNKFVKLKMLPGNNKLYLLTAGNDKFILDLETFNLESMEQYKKFFKYSDFNPIEYYFKSDSIIICNEYTNKSRDTLRIFMFNAKSNKIILDKIVTGQTKMYGFEIFEYLLENGLLITWDQRNAELTNVFDINNLEDNLTDIQATVPNEIENIYPNPSNGMIQISNIDQNAPIKVTISNLNGEIVKNFNNVEIVNKQVNLNIQDLPTGSYFLRIQSAFYLKTFKLIKGV